MTLVKGFRSLCFLAGLTLLGGMLWHVGLAGLSAAYLYGACVWSAWRGAPSTRSPPRPTSEER